MIHYPALTEDRPLQGKPLCGLADNQDLTTNISLVTCLNCINVHKDVATHSDSLGVDIGINITAGIGQAFTW